MKAYGVCLVLLVSAPVLAQDDDLEEAQGLPDEKPVAKTQEGWKLPEGWTERSYLWLEGYSRKAPRGDWEKTQGPNAEASVTLHYRNPAGFQAFLDGRALHNSDPKFDRGILEQAGIRYQASERIQLALGKERGRRAPGLIVAPSDFLYAQENLPGQREQRAGVWQGRVAWQESDRSLEFLALPVDADNVNGLPDASSQWKGWALRGFRQFSNFDIQFAAGRLQDEWHEGLSTQGILGAWKVYAEAGWRAEGRSQLAGLEYQGFDKWSLRAEYLHQDPVASRKDLARLWRMRPTVPATIESGFTPFLREHYAIGSISGLGLDDRWNIFATLLRGLDDRAYLGNLRGEWLIDDHQVMGLSLLSFSEGDTQQYALRPMDRQLSLDWKYTL